MGYPDACVKDIRKETIRTTGGTLSDDKDKLRWSQERRLRFIEFRLIWEGGINRAEIMEAFDLSVPQASKDLSRYRELAPGNLTYDPSEKRYFAADRFSPIFAETSAEKYLDYLRTIADDIVDQSGAWIASLPPMDVAVTPKRGVERSVLRDVTKAIREHRSLDIRYQSMNPSRPEPIWRRITPHALGFDGFRWHARAFCHIDGSFKDFLLPRMLRSRSLDEPGASGEGDRQWHEMTALQIVPHPKLTPSQQAVVAQDYGMTDHRLDLPVRLAMLFYTTRRLGLDRDPATVDPRRQHIVLHNFEAIEHTLKAIGPH